MTPLTPLTPPTTHAGRTLLAEIEDLIEKSEDSTGWRIRELIKLARYLIPETERQAQVAATTESRFPPLRT